MLFPPFLIVSILEQSLEREKIFLPELENLLDFATFSILNYQSDIIRNNFKDKPEPNSLWMLIGKKYAFFNSDFALKCQDVWSYVLYSAYRVSNICYNCHKYIRRDVKWK